MTGRGKYVAIGAGIGIAAIMAIAILAAAFVPPSSAEDKLGNTITAASNEQTTTIIENQPSDFVIVNTDEPVMVDELSITATKVTKRTGISYWTPDGVFIVVDLNIENVGQRPVSLGDYMYELIDKDGRTFSSSSAGAAYSDWAEENVDLNPSLKRTGTLVFDVPESEEPVKYGLIIYKGYYERTPMAGIVLEPI